MDDGDPIGERHAPVAKHLFSDTPRPVNVKQRVQHKTHERRHTLARVGADARRLVVCSARSERVKKTGGLGVEPLLAEMEGELNRTPQISLYLSPEWLQVRGVLFQALGDFPEARAAAALALQQVNHGAG